MKPERKTHLCAVVVVLHVHTTHSKVTGKEMRKSQKFAEDERERACEPDLRLTRVCQQHIASSQIAVNDLLFMLKNHRKVLERNFKHYHASS